MTNIINYLNCGRLVEYDNMADFIVESNKDNLEKIIPFFRNNNILGVKAKDFEDWVKVANIINSKPPGGLTSLRWEGGKRIFVK